MLVEQRIAALGGIENADAKEALEHHQHQGDGQDGRGQDLDPRGGVERPGEQGHPEPGHAGSPHPVNGCDEIDACQHAGKTQHEGREHGECDVGPCLEAERSVEGPARVGGTASCEEGSDCQGGASDEEVPGGQIQSWESHVLGADHDWQEEVAKDRRQAGNHEEEDHDHAMDGEQRVVGLGGDQGMEGRQLHQAHDQAQHYTHREEGQHACEVHHPDALVVGGSKPGPEPAGLQVARQSGSAHILSLGRGLRNTSTATKTPASRIVIEATALVMLKTNPRPEGSVL